MKLLLDMNLSPALADALTAAGWDTRHWSAVGSIDAADAAIMLWARANQRVVITNDLDFSAILAATRASGPSVVQIRAQDLSPTALSTKLSALLSSHEAALRAGAILTYDVSSARLRMLPIH